MRPVDDFTGIAEDVTLPNRKRVRIRALRAGEEGAIRELLTSVSPQTLRLRFLSVMPTLPDPLLQLLASVDDGRKLALVAEQHVGNVRDVIALANLAAIDDDHAELGLVVRDDWQRQSVGTELAIRLMHAAERGGVSRFIAYCLPENTGTRRLLNNVGVIVSSRFRDGVSELVFVRRTADRDDASPQ